MLVIEDLDEATVECAGTLVAREHAAARRVRPELPAGFEDADVCAAALRRLRDSGHRGLVATEGGRAVAVMTVTARQHYAGGRMPACRPKASPSTRTSPIRPGSSLSRSGTWPRR
jgi:hypothetical protein